MSNLLLRARYNVLLRNHVRYGCVPVCDVVPFNPQFTTDSTRPRITSTGLLGSLGNRCFNHATITEQRRRIYATVPPSLLSSDFQRKTSVRRQLHLKSDDKLDARSGERVAENRMEEKEPKEAETQPNEVKLSQRERLKRAVREYGATVIVFHTCISLFTLGVSYAVVSSGVDVIGFLAKIGVGEKILESKLATGASTFVIAYAVHKVFAPARMACTLTATPFIVRYLRKIGFLKAPIPKS